MASGSERMSVLAARRAGVVVATALTVMVLVGLLDMLAGQAFGLEGFRHALGHPDSTERSILVHARAPRVTTALIAGFGLGMSGFVLQSVFANPLASPELVGVTQAAVVGVLMAVATGTIAAGEAYGSLAAALVGGLLGGAITFIASSFVPRGGIILVGVVVAALLSGVSVLTLAMRSSAFGEVLRWLVGSVAGQTWPVITVAGIWIASWAVVLLVCSPVITLLSTGDDHAGSSGLRVSRARPAVLIPVVCVVAGAAALAGAIAFVGLVAGHLARAAAGSSGPAAITTAGLTGASLLCACDALAQVATSALTSMDSRAGVPAGAVAAIVGAVALVSLIRRQETHW